MATFRFLRPIEAYARKKPADSAKRIGGRGARLAWLARNGLPIPRTWVLSAESFRDLVQARLPPGHDPHSLLRLRSGAVLLERAARARQEIFREPLEPGLSDDLAALWELLRREVPGGLSVSSSVTIEDEYLTRMAGLSSTSASVRGPRELAEAVKSVWASALLPSALSYLVAMGVRDIAMAVVLQVVVRADAAGMMVTGPPPGAASGVVGSLEILVNVALGLTIPIVDGSPMPDILRLERTTGRTIDRMVADKPHAVVVGTKGTELAALPLRASRRPSVGPEVLVKLAEVARKLDGLEPPGPFEVEFLVEGQKVWIVRARPSTGAGYPEGGNAETVWSRANVAEGLSGPATPLTWSIARPFLEKGFRHAFASLGCSVPRGLRLLTSVDGRLYLNLTAFMQVAAQVPGLDSKTLLDLQGDAIGILESQVADISRRGFYARLPFTAGRLFAEQMRLGGEVDRFDGQAERVYRRLAEMDLTILPDDALATTLRDVRKLLDQAGTVMLSCASASLASHLALKTVLARLAPVGSERIAQALSAGIGDLESARPGIALAHVAAIARHDEPARIALEGQVVRSPSDLPEGPTRRALLSFLDTYGDRSVREAELMTPRWREDTTPLISMLRALLHAPPIDPDSAIARARGLADRELGALEGRLSLVEMALVRALVARSQRFARLRERMRAWVTRVLGMLRVVALDIDRRLLRVDATVGEGGVFFCTFDELVASLASGRTDLGHIVEMRRAEYARDKTQPDPAVTFVGRPPSIALPPASSVVMRGVPASGGVVEGHARVLPSSGAGAAELCAGEILVARSPDASLSPLFLIAAGLVTELGGPLSHVALVAREYGVPAVASVLAAGATIRTGDFLRVDGDRGIVERLRRTEEDS